MSNLKNIVSDTFKILKKVWLGGFLGYFLIFMIMALVLSFILPFIFHMSIEDFSKIANENPEQFMAMFAKEDFFINYVILGILLNALIVPLSAGIYQNCKYAFEGNPVPIKAIFSFYNSPYTARLLTFTLFFELLKAIFSWLTQIAGFPEISISFVILMWVSTIFTIPMIIFENTSLQQSLSNSIKVSAKNMIFISLVMLLTGVLALSGLFFCGIGVVFTLPIWNCTVFSLYYNFRGVKGDLAI